MFLPPYLAMVPLIYVSIEFIPSLAFVLVGVIILLLYAISPLFFPLI